MKDDDGHVMVRGERYAVCDKTFNLYSKAPYAGYFEFVEPRVEIPLDQAEPFDCSSMRLRHPRETKGKDYDATTDVPQCWDGGSAGSCC